MPAKQRVSYAKHLLVLRNLLTARKEIKRLRKINGSDEVEKLREQNEELRRQLRAKVVKEFHVAYVHWTGGKEHGFVIPADEGGRIRVNIKGLGRNRE